MLTKVKSGGSEVAMWLLPQLRMRPLSVLPFREQKRSLCSSLQTSIPAPNFLRPEKLERPSTPRWPQRVSTIGAQAREMKLLSQHSLVERAIDDLPIPITFLRPAWFMENCRWDVAPARKTGVVP